MDFKFNQGELVMCKYHPDRPIIFIYCQKQCPHKSRLACQECVVNYETAKGFQDLQDVLKDPRLILKSRTPSNPIYKMLLEYFDLLDHDPYKVYLYITNKVVLIIQEEYFRKNLNIRTRNTQKNRIIQTIQDLNCQIQQELNITLGQIKLQEAFKNIIKVKDYHNDPQWIKMESTVEDFMCKFDDPYYCFENAMSNISKIEGSFFHLSTLKEFQINTLNYIEKLRQQITTEQSQQQFLICSMCNPFYLFTLLHRIKKRNDVLPKVTLLFKGSIHGLNGKTFWERCSDKGPTLVICKSKSGYVFGGYTPCKWLPNLNNWQKDESKTSFVFSYTRKEIYPITTGDNAIYCSSSYGPIFGSGNQFYIYLNFQDGLSKVDGKCYSNESYKIENPKTHLMGGVKPELVEMEVFLVE